MPQTVEEKEVVINFGDWMNLKLSLGLYLDGTTKHDANPENLVGEFVSDSQLPWNNISLFLPQVLIC